jgi:molybdenum storage protein
MSAETAAKDVPSPLMRQTLLNPELVAPATSKSVRRLLPWLKVIKIGGHSIMDRGAEAVLPVVEELAAAFADHRLLITTGTGLRGRHVYSVGLDLGLPTGVLAALASTDAEKNGHMLAALMAEHGVVYLPHDSIARHLAAFLSAAPAVVANGYPPYGLYEFPSGGGRIPTHRADAGPFLIGDAYGAAQVLYVDDVDGIYTDDPKDNPSAELIPSITAADLLARDLPSLPIDRIVLHLMGSAKHVRSIQVVNGLTKGSITGALAGEHVGTIVTAA